MTTTLVLGDVAAEQWGLVTTAQARALGVPAQAMARLTERGSLERMTHGVYRVAGAPAEPLDSLRVAWLTLDPARRASQRVRDTRPEVVSHRSAANLHGLGDLESDMHEFITSTRKQTRRDDIRLHRSHLAPDDWTVVDGLPVTTVARTVADLAASRVDGGHLAKVVRDALAVKQVSDDRLSASLAPHAHAYGAPKGEEKRCSCASSKKVVSQYRLGELSPCPAPSQPQRSRHWRRRQRWFECARRWQSSPEPLARLPPLRSSLAASTKPTRRSGNIWALRTLARWPVSLTKPTPRSERA